MSPGEGTVPNNYPCHPGTLIPLCLEENPNKSTFFSELSLPMSTFPLCHHLTAQNHLLSFPPLPTRQVHSNPSVL